MAFEIAGSVYVIRDYTQQTSLRKHTRNRKQLLEVRGGKIVRRYQSSNLTDTDILRFVAGEIGVRKHIDIVDHCPDWLL